MLREPTVRPHVGNSVWSPRFAAGPILRPRLPKYTTLTHFTCLQQVLTFFYPNRLRTPTGAWELPQVSRNDCKAKLWHTRHSGGDGKQSWSVGSHFHTSPSLLPCSTMAYPDLTYIILGIWHSNLPIMGYFETDFLGHSTIVDSNGTILNQKPRGEQVLVEQVQVYPSLNQQATLLRKCAPVPRHWLGSTLPKIFQLSFMMGFTEWVGWIYYLLHFRTRRRIAAEIWQREQPNVKPRKSNTLFYCLGAAVISIAGLITWYQPHLQS